MQVVSQSPVFSSGILRQVNFYSWKGSTPEQKYNTFNRELLAIGESSRQWRHYLEGVNH